MAQYDGSIRINTEIDSKEASAQLITLENRIKKTADKVASLRSKMDELKKTKVPTQEYAELDKELGRLGAAYDKLAERQQRFLSTGGKEGSSAYKRMEYDLDALDVKQDEVIAKMKQLESSGKAFTLGSETEKFANLGQQLKYAENDLAALNQKRSEIVGGNENLKQSYVSLSESVKNAFSVMANRIKHPFQTMKSIASSAIGATSKLLSCMVSVAKKSESAISGIASTLKKATSAIFGLGNGAKKSGGMLSAFASRLKGIALSLLIFNWITKAFNAMVSGMKIGFSNFAGYSAEFANSVQSMKNAMSTLGNQAAAAFAPLVQAAIPMLVSLINTLTRATAAVAQFIAAITGKSTFKKATKVQEDYAGALGKTAGAAKNANKQLSSLDKLNNLTTNDGGGGGGGGGGGANYGDMFEDADVSSQIKDFADLIKRSWESADFTEVGTIIGRKLKEGLDSIDWGPIQVAAEKIGKSLATLINGFVEVDGLGYTTGKSIGEAINTGIDLATAFLDNTHWDSVGKFIGDGLNGIFDTIDWKGLGHVFASKWNAVFSALGSFADEFDWSSAGKSIGKAVSTAISDFDWSNMGASLGKTVSGLFEVLKGFIDETDWKALGTGIVTAIASFFGNIDWGTVSGTISSFATGLLDFLTGLIDGVDWSSVPQAIIDGISDFFAGFDYDGVFGSFGELVGTAIAAGIDLLVALGDVLENAWDGVVDYFSGYIEESGGNIVEGLWNGITDAISNVGSWIKEHIFQPFIDGFKKAFGINSPSTVMKEQGNFIMEGLLGGINDMIGKVVDKFGEIKDKILAKWEEVKTKTKEKWNSIKADLSEKWEGLKAKSSDTFGNIKKTISDKWSEIKSNTSSKWDSVKDKVTGVFDKLKSKSAVSDTIKDTVVKAWEKIKSKTKSIWDGIKNVIKDPINAIIGFINSFIGGVASGINGLIDMLNKFKVDIPEGVPLVGGKTLGFDLSKITAPKIPALATGTVVPPNREFMALLGDNKREPEVVSPLSTIEQAVENAMRRNGGTGGGEITIKIPVEIDGRVLFELVKKFDLAQYQRTGKPSFQI